MNKDAIDWKLVIVTVGGGKIVTITDCSYTPQIESRIPICPRENLSYLWPYPIYDTNIEIPDSFARWKNLS